MARSSLLMILLRRRWRMDHAWMRHLLHRWGAKPPLVIGYLEGRIPGTRPDTGSLVLLGASALGSTAFGVVAGLGAAAWVPVGPSTPMSWAPLSVPVVVAAAGGFGAWKRAGNSPVSLMARISPVCEESLAALSLRVETLLFLLRSAGLLALSATFVAVRNEWPFNPCLAVGFLLTLQVPVAATCFSAACKLRVALARSASRMPFTPTRLAVRCSRLCVAYALGHLTTGLLLVAPARQFPTHFTSLPQLVLGSHWESFTLAMMSEAASTFRPIPLIVGDGPLSPTALVAGLTTGLAVTLAPLALRRPQLLEPLRPSPPPSWGGGTRAWMAWQTGGTRHHHPTQVALARRLRRPGWACAHGFWRTVLPPSEALFVVGAAAALLGLRQRWDLDLALLTTTAVMVGHTVASDIRDEMSPVYSMVTEKAMIPAILQSRSPRALHRMALTRIRLQRRHALTPSVIMGGVVTGVATTRGTPLWLATGVGLLTALACQVGVAVQWYMAPLLLSEAHSLRAEEAGETGMAATLQTQFQAIPRYALVVAPCMFTALALAAPSLVPTTAVLVIVTATLLLHGVAFLVQPHVTAVLADLAWRAGLDGWRLR